MIREGKDKPADNKVQADAAPVQSSPGEFSLIDVMKADLGDYRHVVDERLKAGIVNETQWYQVVQGVRAKIVGLIGGKIGPGYSYHTTSASRLMRVSQVGLEPSPDFEGVEKVSVVPGRKEILPQDLYLARGATEGSVPVILRVDPARLDGKVRDSFEDSGPQSSGYHREIPPAGIEYFDFFVGSWKPIGSYRGEYEPYNLAGAESQRKAKALFEKGGAGSLEGSAKALGLVGFAKTKVLLQSAGLTEEQAVQLAYAKGLEGRDSGK